MVEWVTGELLVVQLMVVSENVLKEKFLSALMMIVVQNLGLEMDIVMELINSMVVIYYVMIMMLVIVMVR